MNKFFFMAVLAGSFEGRPVVQFNTISAQDTRNLTAASLANIQDAGAEILKGEGVEFDNVLVNNIFFLAETTEEEFFRMQPAHQPSADASADDPAASNDEAEAPAEAPQEEEQEAEVPASEPEVEEVIEADQHVDHQLDKGLKETFPASDPVSINPGAD